MDYYRHAIKHAAWTWREGKMCSFHKRPRKKDRPSGRNDKRAAKQRELRARDGEY